MRKFSLLIYVFILLFIFLSLACITYSGCKNPKPIWNIGENDGTDNEFDQERPFNRDFYIKKMSDDQFQRDINDGDRPQIYIHYNLTDDEAGKDLRLFLDTLYATHGMAPYFNMSIKVKPPGGVWSEIGEYKFGSGNSAYPEERYIYIWKESIEPGENIILLENANPERSDYWLVWDSLKLETVVVSDIPYIIRIFLEAILEALPRIILGVLGISFIFIGLKIILEGNEIKITLPNDVRLGSGAIVFLTGVVLLLISISLPLIEKIIGQL